MVLAREVLRRQAAEGPVPVAAIRVVVLPRLHSAGLGDQHAGRAQLITQYVVQAVVAVVPAALENGEAAVVLVVRRRGPTLVLVQASSRPWASRS